jgi:hypothetical protein
MSNSETIDANGDFYPDLTTFPIDTFKNSVRPVTHELNENECLRFFDLVYNYYTSFEFFDDFLLWINDIEYISDINENYGKKILIYTPVDINKWFFENIRG